MKKTQEHKEHKEHKAHKEHKEHDAAREGKQKKCACTNPWLYVSFALGALLIISILFPLLSSKGTQTISDAQAEQKAQAFLDVLSDLEGTPLTIDGINKNNDVFEIKINIQGQQETWFLSPNGELIFPQALTIKQLQDFKEQMQQTQQTQQTQQAPPQTDIPEEDLQNFAQCLTDKGATFYGTEWCGFCNQQKEMLGTSMQYINFVDCDENSEICRNEGITGYPTWKINGNAYSGVQQLTKLAELTGCEI